MGESSGVGRRQPGVFVRVLERVVLLSAVAVGVLVFFRRTRAVGRVLLVVWLVAAWPLAWLERALGSGPRSSGEGRSSPA